MKLVQQSPCAAAHTLHTLGSQDTVNVGPIVGAAVGAGVGNVGERVGAGVGAGVGRVVGVGVGAGVAIHTLSDASLGLRIT